MARFVLIVMAAPLAPLLLAIPPFVAPAHACSFVDVESALGSAAAAVNAYLIASVALAGALLANDIRVRRLDVWTVATVVLVGVHPKWTMDLMFSPDCSFPSVQASIAVLVALCVVAALRLAPIVRRSARARR